MPHNPLLNQKDVLMASYRIQEKVPIPKTQLSTLPVVSVSSRQPACGRGRSPGTDVGALERAVREEDDQ